MSSLKLLTPVEAGRSRVPVGLNDRTLVLGSCFADNLGSRMQTLGFNVCVNPFGTLYNPVSLYNSIARLASDVPFSEDECVEMGAGAGRICSFFHHTSFSRPSAAEFLETANTAFSAAAAFWRSCNRVILTLGTAWCYEHLPTGEVVSNCLKRDEREFRRKRLTIHETATLLLSLARKHSKKFIITVSPVRHTADGAHGNQLSKSTLLIAAEALCEAFPERCDYFPAYEIVMDELRDYRFYAEDMVHPSTQTVDYLWSRFVDFAVPESDLPSLALAAQAARQARHRPLHPQP